MAIATFGSSIDMHDSGLALPADAFAKHTLSSTLAHYFDDASNYWDFIGTGLTYDANADFVAGTITSFSGVKGGSLDIEMTGVSADAAAIHGFFATNDSLGLWNLLLGGNDIVNGSDRPDSLIGGAGNDRIYGNGGDDTLEGNKGRDKLWGGSGVDNLSGAGGGDTLDGGAGADFMKGGGGADNFVFSSALGATNVDTIGDFRASADTILLSASVFAKAGAVGAFLSADAFYAGASAHDASDRIIYDSGSGKLYYDADGNASGHAQVQFAQLMGGQTLTEDDFRIV